VHIQKFQTIVDQLRSMGSDVSEQDLVLFTLQGLGTEYENFVMAISMRLEFRAINSCLMRLEFRAINNSLSTSI
jgi:gag-polypeptide of LTR copia-type